MVVSIGRDWWKDIKESVRSDNLSSGTIKGKLDTSSPRLILQLVSSNWPDILVCVGLGLIFIPSSLKPAIIILLAFLVAREVIQLAVSVKRYISSPENALEMIMIGLVLWIITQNTEENVLLNRHLAAIALVLSWAEMITLIGRHPKLLHCNVYVTMFYKVLNSFFFFLLWYSLFIIAFGLGFYIMLHNDNGLRQDDGLPAEDQNHLFNGTWLSLVKTSAMFVGELEFSDIPINSATYNGMLAYVFFLSFIFLTTTT